MLGIYSLFFVAISLGISALLSSFLTQQAVGTSGLKVYVELSPNMNEDIEVCIYSINEDLGCQTLRTLDQVNPIMLGPFVFSRGSVPEGESFTVCAEYSQGRKCIDHFNTAKNRPEYVTMTLGEEGLGQADSLEFFEKVLEVNPNDTEALNNLGGSLSELGNDEEAIEYYDKAISIDPFNIEALYNKGLALYNLGRYEEANKYLDTVLRMDPNNIGALDTKGLSLAALGFYHAAIGYYDRVLEIDPNNLGSLYNKGFALVDLKNYPEAIRYYKMVIMMDPDNLKTLVELGNTLLKMENYAESIEYYDRALEIDPTNVDVLVNKGVGFYNLNVTNYALHYFDKALQFDPYDIAALNNKGSALMSQKNYSEAKEYYTKVLKIDPDDPDGLNNKLKAISKIEDIPYLEPGTSLYIDGHELIPLTRQDIGVNGALLPPEKIDDRPVTLYIKALPLEGPTPVMYLYFKLIDLIDDRILRHVTYDIETTKQENGEYYNNIHSRPSLDDVFHSHNGLLTLRIQENGGPFQIYGIRDENLSAWTSSDDVIDILGSLPNTTETYGFIVSILGVNNDMKFIPSDNISVYGASINMTWPNTEMSKLQLQMRRSRNSEAPVSMTDSTMAIIGYSKGTITFTSIALIMGLSQFMYRQSIICPD